MRITKYAFSKEFKKQMAKLPIRKRERIALALKLAKYDCNDPRLRLHELQGEYAGTFSISAGGNLRIHFRLVKDAESKDVFIANLQAVGTHSQLYG